MLREKYVTNDGKKDDYTEKYKKIYIFIIGLIVLILVIAVIYIVIKNKRQHEFCSNIRDNIKKASIKYAEERGFLPTLAGDYVNFTLDDLINEKYINKEDIVVKESVPTSDIVITKYKKDYIVTVDLDNAEYCTTKSVPWKAETTKYDKNKSVVSVVAYYNYRNQETNTTKWSIEVGDDELKDTEDKKYHIRLPINEKILPAIPTEGILKDIEVNKKVYYQYQDKKWRFYDIQGDYTNYFSATKPDGYANYDANTKKMTDWTEFSQTYPEEKSYRRIDAKSGYKWYYLDGDKKVYYNNKMYAVKAPLKYNRREKDSVKMYRYQDEVYRWYNGKRRRYSIHYNTAPKGYTYKDDELVTVSSWSSLMKNSSLDSSNREYRTERTVNRYQFRKKYVIYYLDLLTTDLKKDAFLEKINYSSLEEIMNDNKYNVKVTYKFQYK